MAPIFVDREKVGDFCRKHHIRKLAFFGSVLRENFGPDSDVDVLVEFEPGQISSASMFKLPSTLFSHVLVSLRGQAC